MIFSWGFIISSNKDFIFKLASEDWEFSLIADLNYATFVEEIPQHETNNSKNLIDRFHKENKYFICLKDKQLIGMVASRDIRPFSLDEKLGGLGIDNYLPSDFMKVEIRLLSIQKKSRGGRVIQGLLTMLARHCVERGYDLAIISGNVSQSNLYQRLGFVPFGPKLGKSGALFQPMYLNLINISDNFGSRFYR